MRLTSLTVENFRAITRVELTDLPDAVVLAGPNGCGKSCVLDAIRLLKSAYGSYAQDEWQMWLNEFQIDLNRELGELLRMFQDAARQLRISGVFRLSEREKDYLRNNLADVVAEQIKQEQRPRGLPMNQSAGSRAAHDRAFHEELARRLEQIAPVVRPAIEAEIQHAALIVDPAGGTNIHENRLLEMIFSTYDSQHLGVIDYHGANRTYNRQRLDSVNLRIDASESNQRQHALYNSTSKYANLKTEMTSAYVRNLFAMQADPSVVRDDLLTNTLKELFSTFFPGKEFLGPQPTSDGRLTFLVRLRNGAEHDIDDLSSGEKEVVYGYLRLHSSAPKDSMILIDEPELHLNPRLVSGLAAFYYRHLGARLGNQLWLVTHSDTLIREAVSHPDFSVYHIQAPGELGGTSQASAVKAKGDLERVVLDLVGDLAAYRPGAKVVVFESDAAAGFDVRMTCTLFPQFEQKVNAISGGSKRRVADLYDVLDGARRDGHLDAQFFAITDADDDEPLVGPGGHFQWDRYHIENYLLEPTFVLKALRLVGVDGAISATEASVLGGLRDCATATVGDLVAHRLRVLANKQLIAAIDLGFDPARPDIAAALSEAIARSGDRIRARTSDELSLASLERSMTSYRDELDAALIDGTWISKFRGREVLRRFAGRYVHGMAYEYFRDLIINKMAEDNFHPTGMQRIVDQILAA